MKGSLTLVPSESVARRIRGAWAHVIAEHLTRFCGNIVISTRFSRRWQPQTHLRAQDGSPKSGAINPLQESVIYNQKDFNTYHYEIWNQEYQYYWVTRKDNIWETRHNKTALKNSQYFQNVLKRTQQNFHIAYLQSKHWSKSNWRSPKQVETTEFRTERCRSRTVTVLSKIKHNTTLKCLKMYTYQKEESTTFIYIVLVKQTMIQIVDLPEK